MSHAHCQPGHSIHAPLAETWGNAIRYDYRGAYNFAETAAFFGVTPALLGLMSLFVNRRHSNWFAGGLFFSILFVAGGTELVRGVAWIPGFRYFNLSRLAGLLAFPGAIMAAHTAETLSGQRQARFTWAGLGAAICLMALITGWVMSMDLNDTAQHWPTIRADLERTSVLIGLTIAALAAMTRWPRIGLIGLMLFTFADLYQWGEPFNPIHSTSILYPETCTVQSCWKRRCHPTSPHRCRRSPCVLRPRLPSLATKHTAWM